MGSGGNWWGTAKGNSTSEVSSRYPSGNTYLCVFSKYFSLPQGTLKQVGRRSRSYTPSPNQNVCHVVGEDLARDVAHISKDEHGFLLP